MPLAMLPAAGRVGDADAFDFACVILQNERAGDGPSLRALQNGIQFLFRIVVEADLPIGEEFDLR